ncbi:Glycosyltransferase involved in cell wall bisynthesis [Cryobacterium flavum]|uniref:Glycosyltransferase involved in cell wall bisynthesis n=1 Tax=Cryobacterium flavum TaxID=1424659 RepID=A0A5E9G2A3_9MICO|nr:glycosyltransferase family 4 protein [Cryobacterium flavum]SDO27250.1 Glycosyltransferase involved in cell wall bisynthesis [Cryobacterium flavum]
MIGLNYLPERTGIAPYTSALAGGLQARGMKVDVFSAHPHYPEWRIHPGFGSWTTHDTVGGVPVRRLRHYVPARPSGVKRLLSEISFGLRLVFSRWDKPDVVVMVSPALFASAIATLRIRLGWHKPVINVWLQDIYSLGMTETGMGGGLVARIVTWVETKTLKAAAGVVVIHTRFADYVSDKLGVDANRVEVVRNWTHFDSAPVANVRTIRSAHGWGADESVVLHAGNMGVKQGLENVVNAARLADEHHLPLRFVLLGNGSQRDELRTLAEGIERLDFIDSLEDAEFQGALSAADILLVNEKPGVAEMAVPSKLTSYFNAGRPVIAATDLTGITADEIAAANAGLIVQAGDAQAMVDAAMSLAGDPTAAARLGANGLQYRNEVLGEDAAIDRYASWLRQLAAEKKYATVVR